MLTVCDDCFLFTAERVGTENVAVAYAEKQRNPEVFVMHFGVKEVKFMFIEMVQGIQMLVTAR
jgi:hypothetical protein